MHQQTGSRAFRVDVARNGGAFCWGQLCASCAYYTRMTVPETGRAWREGLDVPFNEYQPGGRPSDREQEVLHLHRADISLVTNLKEDFRVAVARGQFEWVLRLDSEQLVGPSYLTSEK